MIGEATGFSEGRSRALGVGSTAVNPSVVIWDYVKTLPTLKRRAYAVARQEWDSGVTERMVEASYRVIDVMQDILVNLAARYPIGHFDAPDPRNYISELIATRFRWHRYHHEPYGHGQNGAMVHSMVAGSVLEDVERMIEQVVGSLTVDWASSTDYDYRAWCEEWRNPERETPRIDVSVFDGRSVVVTVTNKSGPFTLLLRSRLLKSTHPIDHSYPFEYSPRKVAAGDVISNYTIAESKDDEWVFVLGEGKSLIQAWRLPFRRHIAFEVGLTFLVKTPEFTRTISAHVVSITQSTGADRLTAVLRRSEHNDGSEVTGENEGTL